ncbi:Protein-glutamate methylesterase/protein-glutamine glutaminase [Streptomyces tendae]
MEQTRTTHNGVAATPGAQRRVLVVEDDATIVDAIAARLRAEGFLVQTALDGPAAVDAAEAWQPDLMVLDVVLFPGFDGLEVCRRVQAQHPVPVLMLTARDDETDMLVGLGVGADDYMTKPFSMRELAARVHVLLRRVERAALAAVTPRSGILRLGELNRPSARRRDRVRAGAHADLDPGRRSGRRVCLADTGRAGCPHRGQPHAKASAGQIGASSAPVPSHDVRRYALEDRRRHDPYGHGEARPEDPRPHRISGEPGRRTARSRSRPSSGALVVLSVFITTGLLGRSPCTPRPSCVHHRVLDDRDAADHAVRGARR